MAFDPEDSFVSNYGEPLDQTGTPMELFDAEEEARLERELEGGGSDSDSSLDIHTPLPYVALPSVDRGDFDAHSDFSPPAI